MLKFVPIALPIIGIMTPMAYADEARWELRVPVFVAAGTHLQESLDSTTSFNAISGLVEMQLWSRDRSWSASSFVNYRTSLDSRVADSLKSGIMLRHRYSDWDSLAAIFRISPRGKPGSWGYAGRIRYRLAANHKIGVESFGNHRQLDASFLMLGYYGDLSSNISLQLVAGASMANSLDRAARLEVIWQVN